MSVSLAAIAVAFVVTLGYVAACCYWPFGACRRCHGTGKSRSPLRKFWRECPRCEGTGRRVRIGRRIYAHIRHEYRNGNK
ncbi:hypothetical protein [Stackebrandtia nassauensis]|uniref:Uncharacterized protein n=1 Tax=Stackebrandtia nassauensis (strain DSM 44728 / CIP 108903 / NRRL B-16338 / NBRC 102104 / LLR-40K-21) TaxID=446470 RepID=D3Q974_STANL|nr:hypothetical protein [Stackebrandtia nassauensis]ADD40683.1 hypothetical protein Snas_0973 [Stackebrandtia nassauensis DSM 44728]